MRLAVRLSIDTMRWINELEKIYNVEFGGLTLGQGHVVSKAYHLLSKSPENLEDINWVKIKKEIIKISDMEIESLENNNTNGNVTSLNLSNETIDGVKEMQKFLPDKLGGKRVNVGYCIQLIVKAALLKNKGISIL
ncbi:nucleotide pyrophosphatase [Bacillus mycoides]|uniref:nucleotide pyrophosphatase n=1 Tax=Bacillus mycoides TaxID=1405 RepID=UPI001F096693